ncbi:cytochrome P450 9e2 [Microplitis demolitor]|uniref:cytochrome P450 9e2 n=1 Tax=Microplitis demolitor TaxID=69319 RepID=UPI000440028C|nr:cytochrome P450 9e2 [Microplitis demolitor]
MDVLMILIAILVTIISYYVINQLTYWSRRKIPHLPPVPILGNMMTSMILKRRSPAKFTQELYKKFPGISYLGLMNFNTPTILINDPELIKEVFIKNFDNNPDHLSFITEEFDPILGTNVFSLRGDRWRQVRGALTPSFTATKMKFLFTLMEKVSANVIHYLRSHPSECQQVDTKDLFTRYASDVIATSAFGLSVDSLENRRNEFYLRGKDATNLTGFLRILKFMLGVLFPRLMRWCGLTYLTKDTNRFFIDLIHQTVETRDKEKIVRPDMIHLLMQARDQVKDFKITINDIVAQAFIFFLAGFDTTSTTMGFIVHQLAYNQDVQDKLHAEIVELIKDDDTVITYELLAKMKYMEMVIYETLRFFPPVVLLDRVCSKKFKLPPPRVGNSNSEAGNLNGELNTEGLMVEKGTVVWAPAFALQRDEKYFPEPDKFDPERFSEENKGQIEQCAFMPFGVGPRKCIGERFAMMEMKLMIARLIKDFKVKPCEKTSREIVFDGKSLNLVPKGGIWVKFEKR